MPLEKPPSERAKCELPIHQPRNAEKNAREEAINMRILAPSSRAARSKEREESRIAPINRMWLHPRVKKDPSCKLRLDVESELVSN